MKRLVRFETDAMPTYVQAGEVVSIIEAGGPLSGTHSVLRCRNGEKEPLLALVVKCSTQVAYEKIAEARSLAMVSPHESRIVKGVDIDILGAACNGLTREGWAFDGPIQEVGIWLVQRMSRPCAAKAADV